MILSIAIPFSLARPSEGSALCEDIDHDIVMVGESRYEVLAGTDEGYANAYADGGNELSIGASSTIGGANTSADSLGFMEYAFLTDSTGSDCVYVTFEHWLSWSNSVAGGCPSSPYQTSFTAVVNTCSPWSLSDLYYGGFELGGWWFNYYQYWGSAIVVNGYEVDASDGSCYRVRNQSNCTLIDE